MVIAQNDNIRNSEHVPNLPVSMDHTLCTELTTEEKRSLAAVHDAGFKFGKCCAGDVLANGTATPAIAIYLENGAALVDDAVTCGILPNLDERIFHSLFRAAFDQGFNAEKMAQRN